MITAFATSEASNRIQGLVASPISQRMKVRTVSFALCTAIFLAGCSPSEPSAQLAAAVPEVGVVKLVTQSQQIDAALTGRTAAFLSAEVRPQVSGIVQKRLFTEGAIVKKGQSLYQLDASSLRAAQASAQAALAKARASQKTLQTTAKRNAELVKLAAISQQAYEESQAAADQAAADVAVAQAALDAAQINLNYSNIEAPISGRISLSNVTPGALVTANQTNPLTEIVQMDPMYVDFTQSTAELLQLRKDWEAGRYEKVNGDEIPVRIRLEDGSEYAHPAKLAFSGLIVNPTMGTVTLRAVVPNPQGELLPGMFVQAQLPTGLAPEAILVPQQSVTRDLTGRAHVLVVNTQGIVEKRAVDLGRAIGAYWLLDKGLQDGEQIVVDGFQRIQPGDKVQPVEVDLNAKKGAKPVDAQAAAAALRAASGK